MSTKSSKLPKKPTPVVDPISGRKHYPGSISDSGGGEVSEKQRKTILEVMKEGPAFASKLSEIAGISQFNPAAQQGLALHLADLLKNGIATFDQKKGWSLTPAGLQAIPKKSEDDE